VALTVSGRLEAFVSWLPVPARSGWMLDLMRRRPDAVYGVMEALIARSIGEAANRGILEVSLGVAPRIIASEGENRVVDRAMRAMFWGIDRFQRTDTLHRFKTKFGPSWEDRYLAIPGPQALPEVMVALVRAHLASGSRAMAWRGFARVPAAGSETGRRAIA